jgi:hypothetical protein
MKMGCIDMFVYIPRINRQTSLFFHYNCDVPYHDDIAAPTGSAPDVLKN